MKLEEADNSKEEIAAAK